MTTEDMLIAALDAKFPSNAPSDIHPWDLGSYWVDLHTVDLHTADPHATAQLSAQDEVDEGVVENIPPRVDETH